jgi:hypothetical protein
MGFDVYGKAPKAEVGEYFRNNVWWWHPLAEYVLEHMQLPENDGLEWNMNNGYEVSAASAEHHRIRRRLDGGRPTGRTQYLCDDIRAALEIAERLGELVANGETAKYVAARDAELASLADAPCAFCDGKGTSQGKTCLNCEGKGVTRPWITNYLFTVENVEEFAAFCRESGGFTIY